MIDARRDRFLVNWRRRYNASRLKTDAIIGLAFQSGTAFAAWAIDLPRPGATVLIVTMVLCGIANATAFFILRRKSIDAALLIHFFCMIAMTVGLETTIFLYRMAHVDQLALVTIETFSLLIAMVFVASFLDRRRLAIGAAITIVGYLPSWFVMYGTVLGDSWLLIFPTIVAGGMVYRHILVKLETRTAEAEYRRLE